MIELRTFDGTAASYWQARYRLALWQMDAAQGDRLKVTYSDLATHYAAMERFCDVDDTRPDWHFDRASQSIERHGWNEWKANFSADWLTQRLAVAGSAVERAGIRQLYAKSSIFAPARLPPPRLR